MRILHVGKYYPPHRGGMETALRNIAEALLERGHEVRVLVAGGGPRTRREDLPGAAGALIRAGVVGTLNSQPLTPALPALLRRELRHFRPHVLHLHLPNPLACLAWRLVCLRRGGPLPTLAIWHHADIVRQRLGARLVAPLVRGCLAGAQGICVSSETWRRRSEALAPWRDRVAVIPFGIDLRPFLALEAGGEGPFLFVGRLVAYKGLRPLLEALAAVPAARLDVVGDGPLRAELVRRSTAPDLAGRVRFLGEVADDDLPGLMARSRALVLPSLDCSETFGLVLVEAMAAGLPLVTSDLPTGVRELNRPQETGWLVRPGDVRELALALAAVSADPRRARRFGANGRRIAAARHDRSRLGGDLAAWYASLVSGSGREPGAPSGG